MRSMIKLSAIALTACVAALPAMAAGAPHAKPHHAPVQHQAFGKIERINSKHNTLTINHRVYRLAPQFVSTSFKSGQKVQITYRKGRGHRMVEKISAVSA